MKMRFENEYLVQLFDNIRKIHVLKYELDSGTSFKPHDFLSCSLKSERRLSFPKSRQRNNSFPCKIEIKICEVLLDEMDEFKTFLSL